MKFYNTLSITIISILFISTAIATELNGRINIINNDGTNYKVMLQINTDFESRELGGATIVLNYDNNQLFYPDEPEMGVDFIFYNFNLGYYDEATVTKVSDTQIWINVDLISDEYGTLVTVGPYQWTNLVLLNFSTNSIITNNVLFWNIYNPYWGVYDSDNATIWSIGNFDNVTTSINNEVAEEPVNSFILNQNYPNPFNPSTRISWQSPISEWNTLKVYDILGNEVVTLVDELLSAGRHEVEFSTNNTSTTNVASGIYFYRLQVGSFVKTKKMVLMK